MRPAGCLKILAGLVLAAFIHHVLIFHPFFYDRIVDTHGSAPMYDAVSSVEVADDNDTVSFHDRHGVVVPLPLLDTSASGASVLLPLLLTAAAEHPPKA